MHGTARRSTRSPVSRLQGRADLRAGVAAVAADHKHHVDRPHVDALDDLLDVRAAARGALRRGALCGPRTAT